MSSVLTLRRAAGAAGGCTLAAHAVAGTLSSLPAVLFGVAMAAAVSRGPRLSPSARPVAQAAVLLVALVTAVARLSSGDPPPPVVGIALALGGLLVAQALACEDGDDAPLRPFAVLGVLAGAGSVAALGSTTTAYVLGPFLGSVAALLVLVTASRDVAAQRRADGAGLVVHPLPSPRRPQQAAAVVAVVVCSTLVAVLVVGTAALTAPPRLGGGSSAGSPDAAGTSSGSGGITAQGPLDLRTRGALGDRPVAEVPAAEPDHWRSAVYDVYTSGQWNPSTGNVSQEMEGATALFADGSAALRREARTLVVRPLRSPSSLLLSPGRPVQTVGTVADVDGGYRLAQPEQPYEVWVSDGVDPGMDEEAADARWLSVPVTIGPRTRALAARLRSGDLATTLTAVADTVRASGRYTLEAPVPPAGIDPVDALLWEDHQGFCTQFASAAVVLLRLAGIPARLVTGYAFGHVVGDTRVLRDGDAHAWAQAWWPGRGWVDVEATPSAASARPDAALRELLRHLWFRLLLAVLVVLVPLAVAAVVRRRRARRRTLRPLVPGFGDDLLAAYARFDGSLDPSASRAPGETLAEQAARLPATGGVLRQVERAAYAATPPTPEQARSATATLERLSREPPARRRLGRWRPPAAP